MSKEKLQYIKSLPASEEEHLKENGNSLRGTIQESLDNSVTGSIAQNDQFFIKFHGIYQQKDRDKDESRLEKKLEPLFSFLIRVRVPGGITTPEQWLALDALADTHADKTLKLTTRQAFQFHGVFKRNLKETIAKINQTLLDTISACGDVNRNVMSSANLYESPVHEEVARDAARVSSHFIPTTSAYHEIWLDGKLVAGGEDKSDPIYLKHYLPRKFKTAFAIPPSNDTDVLSNDLGFIAIVKNGELQGYNLTVGGGMAFTFGNNETYPRVADVIGYFPKEQIVQVSEAVVVFQRDHGNRSNRKNARLKYTIDYFGKEYFISELKRTHQIEFEAPAAYKFNRLSDSYGWKKGADGLWHYTLFVEGGKLIDTPKSKAKTAIREIAKIHDGTFILTGNQNLVIAKVPGRKKKSIDKLLETYAFPNASKQSALRLNSIACAALPLCSLAFAEAERYLPSLVSRLEVSLDKYGLLNVPINIRMTGCANGCGRPFLAEIGFVGRSPGKYNLYLGASFVGDRLNKLYKEMLSEDEIVEVLDPMFKDFAEHRNVDEHFGDFVLRKNYIKATTEGKSFHD